MLSMKQSCFPNFPHLSLVEMEGQVLSTLHYNIVPLATPTAFMHHLLLLWPDKTTASSLNPASEIASRIVGDFWESASLYYV